MLITRGQILSYARSLIGTPFHHQGRQPGLALDCIGVLRAIANHFRFTNHDFMGYSKHPDGETLERELNKCLEPIQPMAVQPGDVLTFWVRHPGKTQHAGIATNVGILHSYHSINPVGVTETVLDEFWCKRVSVCYRFPNVDPTPFPIPFRWPIPPVITGARIEDPRMMEQIRKQLQTAGGCEGCGG
jgi:hypothetical protein